LLDFLAVEIEFVTDSHVNGLHSGWREKGFQ
jgi:hypothetical protein